MTNLHRVTTCLVAFIASFVAANIHAQTPATSPAVATPANKADFHIYLLMGQSNMAGRDTRPLASQVDNPRVLALNADGAWAVARDPIHIKIGRTEPGAGPGIPFALTMLKSTANTRVTIGLIPCAVGGSPLRRWTKGRGGDLYDQALLRAKAAAKVGIIKGVLWHQGETDAAKSDTATSYETRLKQMITDLRNDLGQPDLPVVVGQLGEFLVPEKEPFADTVRAAIKHIPATLRRVGYADSTGLGDKGDKLHFSADAARELGVRYAEAMAKLQINGRNEPPSRCAQRFEAHAHFL